MVYIIGSITIFCLAAILGNVVVEGICAIKEKRKPDFIKAFKE